MPESQDKSNNPRTEAPAKKASKAVGDKEGFFGSVMTLEEAEALRKGRSIGMDEFKTKFGLE